MTGQRLMLTVVWMSDQIVSGCVRAIIVHFKNRGGFIIRAFARRGREALFYNKTAYVPAPPSRFIDATRIRMETPPCGVVRHPPAQSNLPAIR